MYNAVSTQAPSLLIGSSSSLQVIRTTIKSRKSANCDQILLWKAELAVIEHLEKNGRNLVNTLASSFYWIFFILVGNEDMHESLDEYEFRQDPTIDYEECCP